MCLTVNICLILENKSIESFEISAVSIDKNISRKFSLFLVDCGLTDTNKQKVELFCSNLKNIENFVIRNPKKIEDFEKLSVASQIGNSFYCLAIPDIFPEVEKIIYLGHNIVVDRDITDLWNTYIRDKSFGAVEEDGNFLSASELISKKLSYGMDINRPYCNTNVLLMYTKDFKDSKILERVIDSLANTHFDHKISIDGVINSCLHKREYWALNPRCNFQPFLSLSKICLKNRGKPIIINYSGIDPFQFNYFLIKIFHMLWVCRHFASFLLKFRKYSKAANDIKYRSSSALQTLKIFFKELFKPLRGFVRNISNRNFRHKVIGQQKANSETYKYGQCD